MSGAVSLVRDRHHPGMQHAAYGIGWFTLSLINAGLAQAKGRSGWNWWLLSLLLGPLATTLIVIWPTVTRDTSVPSGQ